MSKTLLSTITDRAHTSYTGDTFTADFEGPWVKHWFATAEQWLLELKTEGLLLTAERVSMLIEDQKRFLNSGAQNQEGVVK